MTMWPVFRVPPEPTDRTDEEFAVLLATLDGLFLEAERFGMLLDVRRAPGSAPSGARRCVTPIKCSSAIRAAAWRSRWC